MKTLQTKDFFVKNYPMNILQTLSISFSIFPRLCIRFLLALTIITIFAIYSPNKALSLDVHSIVDKQCQFHTGIIIQVTESNVGLLNIQGKYFQLPRKSIRSLLVYNVLQNPISTITLSTELKDQLLDISIKGSSRVLLRGWPVKFVEDLVLFYDLNGKSHVLNIYDITRIRPVPKDNVPAKIKMQSSRVRFVVGTLVPQCPKSIKKKESKGVRPTLILSDQIKRSEFLSNFQKGYLNLDSYKDRTYLYARPFLFPRKSRLGFIYFQEEKEMGAPILPIYYQWSSGRPYRFQSFTTVGATISPWLPNFEPIFGFTSDLKSHIFNASFIGNISALPAGTPIAKGSSPMKNPADIRIETNYNYMALMGADWGPFSLSFGTFFPVFILYSHEHYRQVLASRLTPTFKFQTIGHNYRIRVVYGHTEAELDKQDPKKTVLFDPDSAYPSEEDEGDWAEKKSSDSDLESYEETTSKSDSLESDKTPWKDLLSMEQKEKEEDLESFSFNNHFIRFGFDFEPSEDLTISLDEVILMGEYSEKLAGVTNEFEFTHLSSSLSAMHAFGHYVSVKAYINFHYRRYRTRFDNETKKDNAKEFAFGGALELLF